MKILIIRHAEPDYDHDSVTAHGAVEAAALADMLERVPIDHIYTSPLGRATATAEPTKQRKNMTSTECEWLREFYYARVTDPADPTRQKAMWDFLPRDFCPDDAAHTCDKWLDSPLIDNPEIKEYYAAVCHGVDEMLATHGLVHDGRMYKVTRPNHDTIAIFCHFGIACVLLSHLLSLPLMTLLQNMCMLPSSVTTLVTEERIEGQASLRCIGFGDTSHLYKKDLSPSFAARFCECYTDDTRH